jgi:hypothetical protein
VWSYWLTHVSLAHRAPQIQESAVVYRNHCTESDVPRGFDMASQVSWCESHVCLSPSVLQKSATDDTHKTSRVKQWIFGGDCMSVCLLHNLHLGQPVFKQQKSMKIRRSWPAESGRFLPDCTHLQRLKAEYFREPSSLSHLEPASAVLPATFAFPRSFHQLPKHTKMASQLSRCNFAKGTRCPLASRPVSRTCAVAVKASSQDAVSKVSLLP